MSVRARLPNRRGCELVDFESGGLRFTASIGRYPDGKVGEMFIDNHKVGSTIGILVRDMAIAFSFAAQHGADIEAIRRALCRDSQGRPLGPLAVALDLLPSRGAAAMTTSCSAGSVCGIARDRAAIVTTAVLQIIATAPEAQRREALEAYLRDEFATPEETLPGDFAEFSEHEDHQQEDIELYRLIERARS